MTTFKPLSEIRCNGFTVSIGIEPHQVALISHSTGTFASFDDIRKGGRLAKAKRLFKGNIASLKDFCFEGMAETDIRRLIALFK